MKRILITGKNSYIGTNLKKWLLKFPDQFIVNSISIRDEDWKNYDFSTYDVVVHVAGIAHVKETKKNIPLYYQVNRDLAFEVAKIAKNAKVKHFIYFSSMSIYGIKSGVINSNTPKNPITHYGKSKLEGENLIKGLEDNLFKVSIIRPPMVYGKKSKGNYTKLSKVAKFSPIFPDFENKRSMIYIDNLCEFIKKIIINEENGVFFPQNKEYVKTSEMVRLIAKTHNKKIKMTKVFNPLIMLLRNRIGVLNKVFGDLVYDFEQSNHIENYQIYNLKKSIEFTELENVENDNF